MQRQAGFSQSQQSPQIPPTFTPYHPTTTPPLTNQQPSTTPLPETDIYAEVPSEFQSVKTE